MESGGRRTVGNWWPPGHPLPWGLACEQRAGPPPGVACFSASPQGPEVARAGSASAWHPLQSRSTASALCLAALPPSDRASCGKGWLALGEPRLSRGASWPGYPGAWLLPPGGLLAVWQLWSRGGQLRAPTPLALRKWGRPHVNPVRVASGAAAFHR